MEPSSSPERISVAAVNDYDLIVDGLAKLLDGDPRLDVRDRIIIGEPLGAPVQVALYDTFGGLEPVESAVRRLRSDPLVGSVVVFSLHLEPDALAAAFAAGAAGFISKGLDRPRIADAIVRTARGERVLEESPQTAPPEPELVWPGQDAGVSLRESEVLVLAAEGLTNAEIGRALYIGAETVKSHLHAAYSKLGVRNRVEATAAILRSGWRRHQA